MGLEKTRLKRTLTQICLIFCSVNKTFSVRILGDITCQASRENSRYRTWFQASSGNSDSVNWPGYEAEAERLFFSSMNKKKRGSVLRVKDA